MPRYRMLETVREYGSSSSACNERCRSARARRAFPGVGRAGGAGVVGTRTWDWLDRLEAERDNLRGSACLGARGAGNRVRMPVGERAPLVLAISRPGRRGSSLDGGAPGWREVAPALRAALMMAAGDLAMARASCAGGRAARGEHGLARELGEWSTLAHALGWRGATAVYEGQFDHGEEFVLQAVGVARAANAPFWHALGLTILAAIARGRGDHARRGAARGIGLCLPS